MQWIPVDCGSNFLLSNSGTASPDDKGWGPHPARGRGSSTPGIAYLQLCACRTLRNFSLLVVFCHTFSWITRVIQIENTEQLVNG